MDAEPQLIGRPLVPGALGFVIGVASSAPGAVGIDLAWTIVLAVAVGRWARARRVRVALLLPVVFFGVGRVVGGGQRAPQETLSRAFGGQIPERRLVIEGEVLSAPATAPAGTRYLVDLSGAAEGPVPGELLPVRGRVRLWVGERGEGRGARRRVGPGDRIRAWARLRRPPPQEFPGGFGARAWAARSGFALLGSARTPAHVVVISSASRPSLITSLERLRLRVHAAIDAALPPDRAGLVRALATGDRSGLAEDDRAAIRDAGLAHLTAVSGFHLGVVTWLWVAGLAALLRRSPAIAEGFGADRAAALLGLPVVVVYPIFVGAAPSAVRAGVMFGLLLIARLLRRSRETWSALGVALITMIAVEPASLDDPGLQLSFAAVGALISIPPAIERAGRIETRSRPWLVRLGWTAGLASLAATVGTAPLVALHFGRVSVIGLIANLPAGPLAALGVPLSLAGGVLATVAPWVGGPILQGAGWAAEGLLGVARTAAAVPGGVWTLPPPSPLQMLLFFGALILFTRPSPRRRIRRVRGALTLALVASIAWVPIQRRWDGRTRVTFLPVGQGDAAVIELPGGPVVVIDAGPAGGGADAGTRVIAPFLRHRNISSVDLFVVTHPHADHIGGLLGLLDAVPIERVWWSGDRREGPQAILQALERLRGPELSSGVEFRAGEAVLEVLAPSGPVEAYDSVNDASVVVRLRHGDRAFLFPGDVEEDGEGRLVAAYGRAGLRADVLKAAHHGSRTSSTRRFLDAVRPIHVVISCGRGNGFRFPHREALERIGAGPAVWRTDEQGAISAVTDGETLRVEAYLP